MVLLSCVGRRLLQNPRDGRPGGLQEPLSKCSHGVGNTTPLFPSGTSGRLHQLRLAQFKFAKKAPVVISHLSEHQDAGRRTSIKIVLSVSPDVFNWSQSADSSILRDERAVVLKPVGPFSDFSAVPVEVQEQNGPPIRERQFSSSKGIDGIRSPISSGRPKAIDEIDNAAECLLIGCDGWHVCFLLWIVPGVFLAYLDKRRLSRG